MKGLKKLLTGILAATLVMGASITVCAQDITPEGVSGNATISVTNAAKGETYKIYKLFDATISDGSIAYTSTSDIPAALSAYFVKDNAGNITAKDAAFGNAEKTELSGDARDALKEWAASSTELAEAVSDGSTLTFKNLPYGYYVVTTTQGEQAITVESTNPSATIVDKNSSTPTFEGKSIDGVEEGQDAIFAIGEVVHYTVSFTTSNYDGAGTAAELITSYYIKDTLPEGLDMVEVDSIIIDGDGDLTTTDDQDNVTAPFDENGKIEIAWADANRNSYYKNGSTVTIKYHGTVNEKAVIDGAGNTNTVEWGYNDVEKGHDTATFYTFAIAIKKVDQAGNALSGATFRFPFAVVMENGNPKTLDDGSYVYAGSGETELTTTNENGAVIVVRGLKSNQDIYVTETVAPNGYNKLTEDVKVTPTKTGATTTSKTWLLDEDGNIVTGSVTENTTTVNYTNEILAAEVTLVVNKTGSLLPSTGGIGTTIFYIIGGILIIAGVAYFIVRRKANAQ